MYENGHSGNPDEPSAAQAEADARRESINRKAREKLPEAKALQAILFPTRGNGGEARNDGEGRDGKQEQASCLRAKPYVWRDPKTIPPRKWLYGSHYIRGFLTATVAPGGLGKTSLQLVESVSMACGKDLLSKDKPAIKQYTVWYWNLEDPYEEIERRIAAILLYYGLRGEDIEWRLYVNSGRDDPVVIAKMKERTITVVKPVVEAITSEIKNRNIDVLVLDPFVSCHELSENDNTAINIVAKIWGEIADKTNCCVELAHHTRKTQNGGDSERTTEDARGASGLRDAARSMRVLNVMSKSEATNLGLLKDRRAYFRSENGKPNMRAATDTELWYKFVSQRLDNATEEDEEDWVGVVTPWRKPAASIGLCTDDLIKVQDAIDGKNFGTRAAAHDWAGYTIGKVLNIDTATPEGKKRVRELMDVWTKTDVLREVIAVGGPSRRERPTIMKEKTIIRDDPTEVPF